MPTPTFEQVKEIFTSFVVKNDSRIIQVDEANAAAAEALVELTQDQDAEADLAATVDVLKQKAIAYGTDPGVTLDDVLAAAQAAVVSNGKHVIEHGEAAAAFAKKITEQAQADASTADTQTSLDEVKQVISDFTL